MFALFGFFLLLHMPVVVEWRSRCSAEWWSHLNPSKWKINSIQTGSITRISILIVDSLQHIALNITRKKAERLWKIVCEQFFYVSTNVLKELWREWWGYPRKHENPLQSFNPRVFSLWVRNGHIWDNLWDFGAITSHTHFSWHDWYSPKYTLVRRAHHR